MEEKKKENEKRIKPTKRLNFKDKKLRVAGAVYIALALCVVTVMVLSIYTFSPGVGDFSGDINLSTPDLSLPDESLPEPDLSDEPAGKEESGIPYEQEPSYTLPAAGKIIKGYCMDTLVFSPTMQDYRVHPGVDIAGKVGDPVFCYTDGYVTAVRNDPFMGRTVEITHDHGLKSVYQNLQTELPPAIVPGAAVKTGDIIGAIGETAIIEAADEPHLHFELILDGRRIDCQRELSLIKN